MTSLHYHFPWLIKANLRWSIFCAATGRKMRRNLDWEPFYAVADRDLEPRERLREYARIAHERFETEKFRDFCRTRLGHLDELAYDFFGSETHARCDPPEGDRPLPGARDRRVHRAVLAPGPAWREQEGARGDEDGF